MCIRDRATELGILFVTASQLNRSAVDEIEFDHSHIAGGISKINTADNLIGIFSSRAMRERGRVQIQFMKTRSSSGVGSKLDLAFNMDSLKIEDLDESEQDDTSTTSIYQKLKTKSSVAPAGENVTENNMDASPQVDATDRLKSLLRKAD